MSSINPDKPVAAWEYKSKEFVLTATGLSLFVVTTVALAAVAYFLPVATNAQNLVSYSVLGSLEVASIVCFIAGMALNRKRQAAERQAQIEELNKIRVEEEAQVTEEPIEIQNEVELQAPRITYSEYIKDVRTELRYLFLPHINEETGREELSGIENFVRALITQNNPKKVPNLKAVHDFVVVLHQELDGFIQNKKEVLRAAINFAVYAMVDPEKMVALLAQNDDAAVIAGISSILADPKEEDRDQGLVLKEILSTITYAKTPTTTLKAKLKTLRDTHQEWQVAFARHLWCENQGTKKEKEEAAATLSACSGPYNTALSAVVDYFWEKSNVEPHIEKWTDHLVPHFLDQWLATLFPTLGEKLQALGGTAFAAGGPLDSPETLSKLETLHMVDYGGIAWEKRGKAEVREILTGYFDILPVKQERRDRIREAVLPVVHIAVPTAISLLKPGNAYRRHVETVLKGIEPPTITDQSWHGYTIAYTKLFNDSAAKL